MKIDWTLIQHHDVNVDTGEVVTASPYDSFYDSVDLVDMQKKNIYISPLFARDYKYAVCPSVILDQHWQRIWVIQTVSFFSFFLWLWGFCVCVEGGGRGGISITFICKGLQVRCLSFRHFRPALTAHMSYPNCPIFFFLFVVMRFLCVCVEGGREGGGNIYHLYLQGITSMLSVLPSF